MQEQATKKEKGKKVYHKPEISSEELCADVALCSCEDTKDPIGCFPWGDGAYSS